MPDSVALESFLQRSQSSERVTGNAEAIHLDANRPIENLASRSGPDPWAGKCTRSRRDPSGAPPSHPLASSLAPTIETSRTFQRPLRFAETEFKQLN